MRNVTMKRRREELLLRTLIRESLLTEGYGLLTEWDVALAYSRGGGRLTEAEGRRGRLLVEGLFNGVVRAFQWIGGKVAGGVKKLQAAGGEAVEAAGKALTLLLEKIPGGKDAFEFLKEFTSDVADGLKDVLKDSMKEFGQFLEEEKEELLSAVLGGIGKDDDAFGQLKDKAMELAKKGGGELKGKVTSFLTGIKENPLKAVKEFVDLRKVLGSVVGDVVGMVMKKKKNVVAVKVQEVFSPFTKDKKGMFLLRSLQLLSVDMGGEEVLEAAASLWGAGKKLLSNKLDMERRDLSLASILPKIIKGLVSGTSAAEAYIRSFMGDPTKLLAQGVKLVKNAMTKLIEKGAAKVLEEVGVDPDSKLGGIVIGGIKGIAGVEGD